jgi:hypothetical protein
MKRWTVVGGLTLVLAAFAFSGDARPALASEETSIMSPDTLSAVGSFTSLLLDTSGNPVVSYYGGGALKLLHCNDPDCDPAVNGPESVTTPDPGAGLDIVGLYTSLALDAADNPVVSYYDSTNGNLKILRCNDPNCAGSGESITSPHTTGDVGSDTSLALDASGYPVVSYYDETNGDLYVMHCNDSNCSGGNESIVVQDVTGDVGLWTSLELDASGFPVVSYYDATGENLKILHCNDVNCAGAAESVTLPHTTLSTGQMTSLELDSSGFPVVSHLTEGKLWLMYCNDVNCSGSNEAFEALDPFYEVLWPSLALDAYGYPVISYYEVINSALKMLHCNDPYCDGAGESQLRVDTLPDDVGLTSSVALDVAGNPVVSYFDDTNDDLKVLHCGVPSCDPTGEVITTVDITGGSRTSITLDSAGNPVVSYLNVSGGQEKLGILHCNDPRCLTSTINSPDAVDTGHFTSIALDGAGNPVVSHYDIANGDLKILHCNDPACAGGDESITAPHTAGDVGPYTSLELDASGYPVVSYYDATNDDLNVMHCNDANCAGSNESIVILSTPGDVGRYGSLELDASGFPVVSYYDATNGDLKILHCDNVNCSGTGESITTPVSTGDVGKFTSLELDASGYPVVSYYRTSDGYLYVMHCNDVECAGNNESIEVQDQSETAGFFHTSLELDSAGYPVISYYDVANGDLKLLHCNDVNCNGTAESITTPDSANDVGTEASLALDANGNPVVSYYDATSDDLRVLHCNDANCSPGVKSSITDDTDGDGCPDADEQQTAIGSETSGGRRDYLNPNDYFNPSGDGENRIDDILAVINQYFDDDDDGNPGLPPYEPGYNPNTDRTSLGPDQWDLGPPNGEQRIDDVLAIIYQYFHDCS